VTIQPTASPLSTAERTPTLIPTPTDVVIQGTITLWHSWDESELPALVQVIADFQNIYPNVLFDVLYIPDEVLRGRFEEEARAGGGPTLLLGPAQWGPALYDAGLLSDLTQLAEEQMLANINQAAFEAVQYKDAIIGLPHTIQGVVLFRNLNIVPDSARTYEELIVLANSSTREDKVGAMLERSFFYSGAHLNGIGGRLMDNDGLPVFIDEKGEEWLDLLIKFEQVGPTDYYTDQDLVFFNEEKVGLIIDGTWNMLSSAETIGYNKFVIDPWPAYGDGALSGYVLSNNIYLSTRITEDQQRASWKFMQYLLSPEAQTILVEIDHLPSVEGVHISDPAKGRLLTQVMSALSEGVTYPVNPRFEAYSIPMDIAIKQVLEEGASPAEALQIAHDSILISISEMEITPTPPETSTPTPTLTTTPTVAN
jgi:maltose-binding protein MalE